MSPTKTRSAAIRIVVVACLAALAATVMARHHAKTPKLNVLTAPAIAQAIVTASDAAVPRADNRPSPTGDYFGVSR